MKCTVLPFVKFWQYMKSILMKCVVDQLDQSWATRQSLLGRLKFNGIPIVARCEKKLSPYV